jgi:hypothetical protein
MLIEAKRPFRLRLHGQVQILEPGHPIELDKDDAEKLLSKAPEYVCIVSRVRWCSPLFGNLEGDVLLTEGNTMLVSHPKLGRPAWIYRDWIDKSPNSNE